MAGGIDDLTHDELLAFANAWTATISGDLAAYGPLAAGDMTSVGGMRDNYGDSILDADQKSEASKGATVTQNVNRKTLLTELRRQKALLLAHGVAEDKYATLGWPASGPSGESVSNATVPIGVVDTSKRLTHTIHFKDASPGASKRKPKDVLGCEIWIKIDGPPPGSEKDCAFLTLDTLTPHTVEYDSEHAGKMVHYLLRWQFKDGSKSAWGETVSATITG